jgi:putative tricarboxylic transport membrane protein
MNLRDRAGDIVSAGLVLAFAVAVFLVSLGFPPPGQPNDPGTAAFPQLIAIGLGVLALLQLLQLGETEALPRGSGALRVVGVVVLLFVYVQMLEPLGFVLSSALFMLAALLLAGARRLLTLLAVPIGVSVVLFWVFYRVLSVPLPRGFVEGLLF